ncbi:hypothetical protein PC9H_010369 [Pleurotus ostreatus]|uniref:Uncharacterized protein n=1 Tax=Pleurotus ostreatus TaxID=5322 RepID=A0A8H6ZPD7_PLEOS|nr:uncharacterized protein PC9H_010369 [Pleurotus ostreatus]KAF7422213.1 hypothetical protein PC9H_010369 [Pleurotus ostreatus]
MADFPIDTAQIVALFLESVLYGVYLVTFVACLRVLLIAPAAAAASHPAYPSLHLPPPSHHTHSASPYNGYATSFSLRDYFKPLRHINTPMLLAALLMLVFATLDVAFGLHNNILAFVKTPPVVIGADGAEEGGPEAVFDDIGRWTNVMKMVNYVAQTFVGDSILLYRCFVVYDRNWWVVAFPILLWLGTTACGIMTSYSEAAVGVGTLDQSVIKPFITSMLVLTLATNMLTTGLIVLRIWKVDTRASHFRPTASHALPRAPPSPLARVMRVLIESGLIYTTTILVLFGTYLAGSNAILALSNAVVQIIGVTFNLIIISTDRARRHGAGTSGAGGGGESTGEYLEHAGGGGGGGGGGRSHALQSINPTVSAGLPMHMLNIHTEVSVQRHRDPIPDSRRGGDIEMDIASSISTSKQLEQEREEEEELEKGRGW